MLRGGNGLSRPRGPPDLLGWTSKLVWQHAELRRQPAIRAHGHLKTGLWDAEVFGLRYLSVRARD